MDTRTFRVPKVPEVFVLFWVVKLLTTGIGEAGSDYLAKVNLLLAAAVGVFGFWLAIRAQLRATRYEPVRYWVAVLMVAIFGTMCADGPHLVLGTPYWFDSAVCALALGALFVWWQRSEGTLSVHSITTARRERFYWTAVLLTFGLGTALGDTAAFNAHLGYSKATLFFGVVILVPLVLWRLGVLNAVAAFWGSYVLTRPLGASIADWLGKPSAKGGLGVGDGIVFAVGLVVFAILVGYLARTHQEIEVPFRSGNLDLAPDSGPLSP
ncbi:MAG: hypothetical protein JWP74_1187 [Marmoricola sp.]|nr:hypothetical protein [Marmoricola sp.]